MHESIDEALSQVDRGPWGGDGAQCLLKMVKICEKITLLHKRNL